ncbi:MAG: phage integrase SAM-like domain-containing protein [Bacteroidota bacterium]
MRVSQGHKYSSLSIYLRALRSLYNQAIEKGIAKRNHYPFHEYSIKHGEPSRRALSSEQFKKLSKADFKHGSAENIGKCYYLASFYLQGINWMDLCYLRYENFTQDFQEGPILD